MWNLEEHSKTRLLVLGRLKVSHKWTCALDSWLCLWSLSICPEKSKETSDSLSKIIVGTIMFLLNNHNSCYCKERLANNLVLYHNLMMFRIYLDHKLLNRFWWTNSLWSIITSDTMNNSIYLYCVYKWSLHSNYLWHLSRYMSLMWNASWHMEWIC